MSQETITIKPVKKVWMCVSESGNPDFQTISYYREISKNKLCDQGFWDWKKWKSKGWKCVRVDVNFSIVIPKKHVD